MAHFFIDRPVFAWVIALLIMLAGALSITTLPVARYPEVAPPTITVSSIYPGASAETIANSVTQIIEQNMKGLDGVLYMTSTSEASGHSNVSLVFDSTVDPDIAQVQVQNKLQLATPFLPQEVQQQGISVSKANSNLLMGISFTASKEGASTKVVEDFVATTVADAIARVPGVGQVSILAQKNAMRIWLNPDKLNAYKLSSTDLVEAVRAGNLQVAVGQLGANPAVQGQQLNATINALGRLETPEQFRKIPVRGNTDGSVLTLGDVARVELGNEEYTRFTRVNGVPASSISISLTAGANALETSEAVMNAVERLRPSFPEGMVHSIAFDMTPFISEAISGVVETLVEAIVLVFLVMLLFLQNLRATLIPTIAVPVVLLGTFGVLAVLGYSINMLTLFAMVLAIGLLVDDAIVVVENVERLMTEDGLSPREATRKSMGQITGALVAVGIVLGVVFVPMTLITGPSGVIYRQFAVTIIAAIALSVLVAIVLTPALCASMLKPVVKGEAISKFRFLVWFNRVFEYYSAHYRNIVRGMLGKHRRYFVIFILIGILAVALFTRLPTGFIPDEDQGWLVVLAQGPVGATKERTEKVLLEVEDYLMNTEKENVDLTYIIQGMSFSGTGQNIGYAFATLKDWSERQSEESSARAIAARAQAAFSNIKDGLVFTFIPPPLPELANSSGYTFYLTDTTGLGHEQLINARNQFLGLASQSPLLAQVRPAGMEDTPQLRLVVDEKKAVALGLSLKEIADTLALSWGGRYIDDFIDQGRVKRVYVQADAPFRMLPEDFRRWSVRNTEDEMVPFSAFAEWRWDYGSPRLERYDGLPAVQLTGLTPEGVSTGDAMAEIERLARELPQGVRIDWTGLSYLERAVGSQVFLLYGLSFAVVFLCLAALYESWSIPTAVLLAAPLGLLGAVLANMARGMERDVYFQVAMLTTIGLSSKNAILIIEFAKQNLDEGMGIVDATIAAVRDRLRPITMTSLAFGLGVLPLAIASGAGSGAQQALGTGVLGGMLTGTYLGIFFIPLLFVVVMRAIDWRSSARELLDKMPNLSKG